MTAALAFALAGMGILALSPPDLARGRLDWLASERVGMTGDSTTARRGDARRVIAGSWLSHWWVGGLFGAVVSGAFAGVFAGFIAFLVGAVGLRCWQHAIAERRREGERAECASVVAALADEYRAGATLGAAFASTAASAERYRDALARTGALALAGEDFSAALLDEPGLRRLGVACSVAGRSGSSLTSVLAGLSADLAADRAVRRAVGSALTGPRTSAALLALLPLVGVAMGMGMGARPVQVLLHTRTGQVALVAGIALDLAGLLWTLTLTRRAMP
jgi:tight adherence protein B